MSTLNLIKARFSKDARINRVVFHGRLEGHFNSDVADNIMPSERNLSDALRWGINHALRPYQKFISVDGTECRAIQASAKGKEFDVAIHVQRRGQEVDYSQCVCRIVIVNEENKKTPGIKPGPDRFTQEDIYTSLYDVNELADYGKRNLFETDLRRIADNLLDGKVLKLWPGIYAALSDDSLESVKSVQGLMDYVEEGRVTISVLKLENTQDNRVALANELAEEFSRAYGDIQKRAEGVGPNVELLEKEMESLQNKRYSAEAILCVSIPVDEEQSNCEIALMSIAE